MLWILLRTLTSFIYHDNIYSIVFAVNSTSYCAVIYVFLMLLLNAIYLWVSSRGINSKLQVSTSLWFISLYIYIFILLPLCIYFFVSFCNYYRRLALNLNAGMMVRYIYISCIPLLCSGYFSIIFCVIIFVTFYAIDHFLLQEATSVGLCRKCWPFATLNCLPPWTVYHLGLFTTLDCLFTLIFLAIFSLISFLWNHQRVWPLLNLTLNTVNFL